MAGRSICLIILFMRLVGVYGSGSQVFTFLAPGLALFLLICPKLRVGRRGMMAILLATVNSEILGLLRHLLIIIADLVLR